MKKILWMKGEHDTYYKSKMKTRIKGQQNAKVTTENKPIKVHFKV